MKGTFCINVGILHLKISTLRSRLHPGVNESKAKLASSEECRQIAEGMQTEEVLGPLGLIVLL